MREQGLDPRLWISARLFQHHNPAGMAMLLEKMGIKVDRWSVRSYNHLSIPPPQTVAAFGMRIPVSIITLSALANGDAGHISGEDILTACNYPSRCDHFPVPVEGDES